jgi:hypothetical protein
MTVVDRSSLSVAAARPALTAWPGRKWLEGPAGAVSVGLVDAADVIQVLEALDGAGVRHWVGGGWGVAALAGRQTRPHRDLDGGFFEYPADAFGRGLIAGRGVGCLSAVQQRRFHDLG